MKHKNAQSVAEPGTSGAAVLEPKLLSLDAYLTDDRSFLSAYLRTAGAIANANGTVTLADYAALTQLAQQSENPALASVLLMHAIEHPTALGDALLALTEACAATNAALRRAAFDAAVPIIRLQGNKGRSLAIKLAKALQIKLSEHEQQDFEADSAGSMWQSLSRQTQRLLGNDDVVRQAEEFMRLTGDDAVSRTLRSYRQGDLPESDLQSQLLNAVDRVSQEVGVFSEKLAIAKVADDRSEQFIESEYFTCSQIKQRVAVLEARVQFERQAFAEDIDDAVYDAGNSIELIINDRLKISKWTMVEVWESMSRHQFSKELQTRLDRMVRRRENILSLLKEDLRLFQSDMRHMRTSLGDRVHHAAFADLMPALRFGTRVVNAIDTVANVTVATGALGAIGAGTAAYVLGFAAVWPLILPVAPVVGAAVGIAGIFKLLTDTGRRKEAEILSKRKEFEEMLREQLVEAQSSFERQLDEIGHAFALSAEQFLQPLMLEAEAAKRIGSMHTRLAQRLVSQCQLALGQIRL